MTNKNILIVLIILTLVFGAYLFLTKEDGTEVKVDATDYVGMSPTTGENKAEADGVLFRVVEIDGNSQPITKDLRPGRINATVENDVVVSYTVEAKTPPAQEPATQETNNDKIIGMTNTEAVEYTKANNIMFRVGAIDGEFLPVTMDYRPGRITAELENDIVIKYTVE
jgi:hypothetical protein